MKTRPLITIVNSSTFGVHFSDHLASLERFADIRRIDLPADVDSDTLVGNWVILMASSPVTLQNFRRRTLIKCSQLVLLFRHGIGYDNVDLEAATELGMRVSRVKGEVEREAVAEYAVALLLGASRMVPQGDHAVKNSLWKGEGR